MKVVLCPTPDQVNRYYDGALSLAEHFLVVQHLRDCESCRKRYGKPGRPLPTEARLLVSPPIEIPLETTTPAELHQVGPYRIVRQIGRGGMGTVYEAMHEHLDRPVALKVLAGMAALDLHFLTRFRREAKAVGRLNHPNVVAPMDAGEHRGVRYLAMELITGTDLGRLVRLLGPLPVPDVCEMIRQIAAGLAHLHEKGLVHRDVKPSNIMLSVDGIVKLLDLGLALTAEARNTGVEAKMTGASFLGTHDYMAPEQWTNPSNVDCKVDIYALGCVLFHLLTGKAPFSSPKFSSPQAKMIAHKEHPRPSAADGRPDAPRPLSELIQAMMAFTPTDRPTAEMVELRMRDFHQPHDLPRLLERTTIGPINSFDDTAPTNPAPAFAQLDSLDWAETPKAESPNAGPSTLKPSPAGPSTLKPSPAGPSTLKPTPAGPSTAHRLPGERGTLSDQVDSKLGQTTRELPVTRWRARSPRLWLVLCLVLASLFVSCWLVARAGSERVSNTPAGPRP